MTELTPLLASYDSFKSGEEASQKLALDATLSARYTAISGDASAAYATSKFFLKQYQYALFGFSQVMLRASFADYADMVNIPLLKQRLARIKPFDPSDYWNVQRYRSLFATIGSHVIFAADYGARMQLVSIRSKLGSADADQIHLRRLFGRTTAIPT